MEMSVEERKYWNEGWPLRLQRRICDICEAEFAPRGSNQKRCSPKCAEKAVSERDRCGAWFIFNRDGFRCVYCGRSAYEDGIRLHADHIVPRSAGGGDTADNLATACARCNHSKYTRRILNEAGILAEVARRNEIAEINPELVIKV